MKLPALLTAVGLKETETEMYLSLLKKGNLTVSGISRESTLHRPAIYNAIPVLREKGLVSERRVGKLIYYSAEPPERLKEALRTLHEEIDTIIPELKRVQSNTTPIVRRLDGKAGVHAVYEDVVNSLKKGEEYYRYSSESGKDVEKIPMPKRFQEIRDEKQLERLVITNPDYISAREPQLEVSMKVVPKEFLPFNHHVSQIIYGNKIAFIDYSQPIATIIENPALAQFQKDIFKMLFRRL